MIYKQTILKNADNSGVVWSKCIKVQGTCNITTARLGDTVLVSIFKISSKKKAKKKIYMGLIVGVNNWSKRQDGSYIRFFKNKILLLSSELKFLGTRVYGPTPKEIRIGQKEVLYKKIISYSWTV
jgi:large subunit ribosomal protein L14